MMKGDYNPKAFWDERFRRYGHTEIDSLASAYDHPLRLKAVVKALSLAKIEINGNTRILDVGCGRGDLISSLLARGALDITGIDVSEEVIKHARKRFAASGSVKLLTMEAQDMRLPPSSFDLVTSITVLQHITDEGALSRAIGNILRVVKRGGYVCVMDFSPVTVQDRQPVSYLTIRSRKEYIQAFENNGGRLICEFGLPRVGVRLYNVTTKPMLKAVRLLCRGRTRGTKEGNEETRLPNPPQSVLLRVYSAIGKATLKVAKPLDNFLFPFPRGCTDMRILIFVKTGR